MQIVTLPAEILYQQSQPIEEVTPQIHDLAMQMVEAMHEGRGIGLAGVQVGILSRLFVVHITGDQPRVFINPEIVETALETNTYEEGCLSIPGIYSEVIRPAAVTVQALNERGKPFRLDAEAMLARVVQHEFDHLNGVLFLDRVSELKRNRLLKQYDKNQRK